ncbi:MAG: sodium:glutamate symporter [Bacteroidales bacterium]|nr:sodium:glutamate symporter [Bacteroidales bacterium]
MFGTTFTAWTLFTDFGIISALLLLSQLMRAKIKWIQQLFIPPCLLTGFIGLALGPNGLNWLPLSSAISVYPAILIAMVFAALALGMAKSSFSEIKNRVGGLWVYAQNGLLMQWGLSGLFGLLVLRQIWPDLHPGIGTILATGYYGGHGTAAAVGSSFENFGWSDATTLGMTIATVGLVSAVLGGLIVIKWATRKNYTKFIADFKDLPPELRTGLLPENKRESMGTATTSSISIESFTFHLALVFVVALGGYMLSKGVEGLYSDLKLPVFSCAFVAGLFIKQLMNGIKATQYICPTVTSRLGGTFTDFLVAFGVASIKLDVVVQYAVPLILIAVFGILLVIFTVFYFGRKILKDYWCEKTIFCYGWWSGTMATGIALLRIVDPKFQSKTLDDAAMAYLPIAPLEIAVITIAPIAFSIGMGLWMSLACLAMTFVCLYITRRIGWWNTSPKQQGQQDVA